MGMMQGLDCRKGAREQMSLENAYIHIFVLQQQQMANIHRFVIYAFSQSIYAYDRLQHVCPHLASTFLPTPGFYISAHTWLQHFCPHLPSTFLPTPGFNIPAHTCLQHVCPHLSSTFLPTPGFNISAHTWLQHFCPHLASTFLPTPAFNISAHTWLPLRQRLPCA